MQKIIIIDGIKTDYMISDKGEVFSLKTNKFLNGDTSSSYRRVLLIVNGVKIRKTVHSLVGEAFIENPLHLPILHHKNGNRLDNSVDNLEWISYSDNVRIENRQKYEKIEEKFSEEELLTEEWRPFRDTQYSFSNIGRMRNNQTKKIVAGHINIKLGYKRDTLCLINGERITLPRHRLVYESFHPLEEIKIINHIDGIRYNNRLNNLENISASENLQKAYTETKTRKVRHCCLLKDEQFLVFFSIAEASRNIKIDESQIRQAINNSRKCHGYNCYELTEDEYCQIVEGSETIERIISLKEANK